MTTTHHRAPAPAGRTRAPPRHRARTAAATHDRAGLAVRHARSWSLYLLFLIGPVLIGLVISFFNTTTVTPGLGDWVGLSNYADVLPDGDFWASMWHSVAVHPAHHPAAGAAPAALRDPRRPGSPAAQWFFRLAFFAPYVVPSSVVCLIFAFMYTPADRPDHQRVRLGRPDRARTSSAARTAPGSRSSC